MNNRNPSKDTYVSEASAQTNFGGSGVATLGSQGGAKGILLQYNLTPIPQNAVIVSATLSFSKASTTHSGNMVVQLRRRRAAWTEGAANWDSVQPFQDPIVGSATINTGLSFPTITDGALKTLVSEWVANPTSNFGLTILPAVATGTDITFYTKENTQGRNPIRLSVTYQTCSVPGTFTLISPANGQQFPANTLSTTLSWNASFGATSYDVYFGPDTNPPLLQTVTTTSRGVGVSPGQTYSWRVVAKNSCGTTASSSGTRSFSVACATLPTPGSPNPADGAALGSQPSVLDWADVSGANSYEVFLNGASIGTISTSHISLLASLQPGEHTWQVRARNSCGGTADGQLWRFTIADRGTLQARVLDKNGNPRTGALCRLYDANGQSLGAGYDRTTGSGGVAPAWTNLPAGHYIVKAFFDGISPFPGEELWTASTVDVAAAATTAVDLQRNFPYAFNHEIRLEDESGALLDATSELEITNPIWIGARVRQVTGTSQTSRISVILDRDRQPPWDIQFETPPQTVVSGSPLLFPGEFSTETPGSFGFALQVETLENGQWVMTDSWDWIDAVTIQSWPSTITFPANHTWQLSLGGGPDDSFSQWSRNPRNVWTDEEGLHLRLEKRNGVWYAPELVLSESLGYGEYSVQVEGNVATMDRHAVLAFWVSASDGEIDIELTRFGDQQRKNGNYVLHPHPSEGDCNSSFFHCFDVPDGATTHGFRWSENALELRSVLGHVDEIWSASPIISVPLGDPASGITIPTPGDDHPILSFWLYRFGEDTSEPSGTEIEVTIKNFAFREPAIVVSPPAAPTWLRATTTSASTIDLLWDDNSDNEDGFKIERKEGPAGPWTIVATLPADAATYQDTTVSCGIPWAYRVWAFNAAGESDRTNEAAATPECQCAEAVNPESLSFDAAGGNGSFAVTACGPWTAVSDASWIEITSGASGAGNGAVGFRVARSNVQSPRTGTISLPELGLVFTVQQAAAPADPGFTSFLWLVGGTLAGQAVDPDHRTVTVAPGAAVSGTLGLRIDSSFASNAVMALGITPSWGDHATSYTDLGHFSTPVSGLIRNVSINYTAPAMPGTYHVLAAFRGEFNAGQVMSATNWGVGTLVWNNGDDLADWSAERIATANQEGTVLADYLLSGGNVPMWVPATAITIVVEPPSVPRPADPTWLRTTPSSSTSIDLLWEDNSNNEDGFKIERKEGPAGPWTIIATPPANTTTYQDTDLTCGTAYAYRVWAFNAGGDSGKTNEAGTTPVCGPQRLFSDDFEDGSSAGWQTWISGWSESGGVYHATNTGANLRNEAVWTAGYGWSDYSVEADLALLSTYGPADGQLLLRYNSETDRISCRLFQYQSSRELQLLVPGQPMVSVPFAYVTGQRYRLRASAVGENITCEVVGHPETRLIQTSLGSFTGTVGLRNTHIPVDFDNLEVWSEP